MPCVPKKKLKTDTNMESRKYRRRPSLWDVAKRITKILVIIAIPSFVLRMCYTEVWSEEARQRHAQRERDAQQTAYEQSLPRKIREANGCEVWAFKPGPRWLYFTRCGQDQTETMNRWEVCKSVTQGKQTRQECHEEAMSIEQSSK